MRGLGKDCHPAEVSHGTFPSRPNAPTALKAEVQASLSTPTFVLAQWGGWALRPGGRILSAFMGASQIISEGGWKDENLLAQKVTKK